MASTGSGTTLQQLRELFGTRPAAGQGDGQLLARFAHSRDEGAFAALVERHGPLVLATCRAVLRDQHDAEDAFQATFLILARQAAKIRSGETLAAWLHRVAHRASVQLGVKAVRRRRKETEAASMMPRAASPGESAFDPNLRRVVHEEVDRLPDAYRFPVVLCDLEGLTYEHAADRLRWSVPTLRGRLARGRRKLRDRLTRRGITAPVAVALMAASARSASAATRALARATVAVATGGADSAGAVALSRLITRGMLMTKIKLAATAAVTTLGLTMAGVGAVGSGRIVTPGPTTTPDGPPPSSVVARPPADTKPEATVEVRGRVVAPDGRPVAGAAIAAAYLGLEGKSIPTATSGPDGRFTIRLPRPSGPVGVTRDYSDRFPWLVAHAPGLGPGWTERVLRADRPSDEVIALVESGTAIEGQVVDLEGRPVADARVAVHRAWFDGEGDLSGWIYKARNGAIGNIWQWLGHRNLDDVLRIEAKAGPDGRFRLDGLGRDRIAELLISGRGVATTQVYAFCRDEAEVRGTNQLLMKPNPLIVHAPRFQMALPPSQPIEGVAKDEETGRPIAGLKIRAAVFDEHSLIPTEGIEARTADDGHYRLDGLAKAPAHRLFVSPGVGQPYTQATLTATTGGTGLEPVRFDFSLRRGVIVRGRVTDKATGRPVRGYAEYFAFANNPHVADFAGFRSSQNPRADLREDGTFEIVALPGRGLVGVRADEERYRGAVGDPKIVGYDAKRRTFDTEPHMLSLGNHHAYAEINLDPRAETADLELRADPGGSAAIDVVGPDGQPLGGTTVKGKSELFQSTPYPEAGARVEVHALDPAHPRRIVILHEGRKLIGSALLKGDETAPVRVQLAPWGAVAGRIVDDEGRPRAEMFISSASGSERLHPETDDIIPGGDSNNGIPVGNDGLFRVDRLVPGLRYSANSRPGFETPGKLIVDLVVGVGEVKDLGDVKVQPAQDR